MVGSASVHLLVDVADRQGWRLDPPYGLIFENPLSPTSMRPRLF
jgi:hypothetical protein